MTQQPLALDAAYAIQQAAGFRRRLIQHMNALRAFKDIDENALKDTDAVQVSEPDDDGSVTVEFEGTRIRLKLIVGLDPKESPVGRVVCFHDFESLGKQTSMLLGEFTLFENGQTSFTGYHGRLVFLAQGADLILAHYLALAFKNNATLHPETS